MTGKTSHGFLPNGLWRRRTVGAEGRTRTQCCWPTVSTALVGDEADSHARFLEALIGDIRVVNIYLPNGNPPGSDKFSYKLAWMDRLQRQMQIWGESEKPTLVGGDFNVIPEDIDCHKPSSWIRDALFQPEPRARYRAYLGIGYIDLIEANEAFAAQSLAVGRELGWDWDRVNVNGGAIALGHPTGATAARLVMTLIYELRHRRQADGNKRPFYGLATLCGGIGEGEAVVVKVDD